MIFSNTDQQWKSALVDIAFFVTLGLLGYHGVLKEAAVLSLLSVYATGRFSVAMNKQQTQQVTRLFTGGDGPSQSSGGSGSTYKAVQVSSDRPPASYVDVHRVPPPARANPVYEPPSERETPREPRNKNQVRPSRPTIPREEPDERRVTVMSSFVAFVQRAFSLRNPVFPVVIAVSAGLLATLACTAAGVGQYEGAKGAVEEACSYVRLLPEVASASALPSDSVVVVHAPTPTASGYADLQPAHTAQPHALVVHCPGTESAAASH